MKTFIPTDEDLTTAAFAQAFAEVFGEDEADEEKPCDWCSRWGTKVCPKCLLCPRCAKKMDEGCPVCSGLAARSGTPTTDEDEDDVVVEGQVSS